MNKQWPLDTAVSFDPYFGEPSRDGDQGYEYLPDGKVRVRIKAPNARTVVLDQFGTEYPLEKVSDEMWGADLSMGYGFKYFFLKIDGADVLNPYLPIGYGACRPMNFLDIPVPGEECRDALSDIPHGTVTRCYYPSSVTQKLEICLVYKPASYDPAKKYPVLYLQHGYGENETGWVYQGHVGRIADQLLHEGKMKEMLIVMGNGMVSRTDGSQQYNLFTQVILKDLIPYIESNFPVKKDKWSRAMAGLSMGSFQTSLVTLSNPDLFGYAGVFSGFLRSPRTGDLGTHLHILDDEEKFKTSYRVFYRAMGTEDEFFKTFLDDDEMLKNKPVTMTRKTFPGGHDWSVWRRCIHDFLPLLFL